MSKDSHIGLAVLFDVPDGQDTSPFKTKFYANSKAGTKECLYYGFASLGNRVLCREGYSSAAGFLEHVSQVKDELEGIIKQVGRERVKVDRKQNFWIHPCSQKSNIDPLSWTQIRIQVFSQIRVKCQNCWIWHLRCRGSHCQPFELWSKLKFCIKFVTFQEQNES